MATLSKLSFDRPESMLEEPKARADLLTIGGRQVWRCIFQPGWRLSEAAKETGGDESCPVPHVMATLSGRLGIQMEDGSTEELGPGEVGIIPPGHDAWVVGDEPYVGIDVQDGLYERLAA